MCLGLARFAAAVKPLDKQADIELCDLTLTYSEQPADVPGMYPNQHHAFIPDVLEISNFKVAECLGLQNAVITLPTSQQCVKQYIW